MSNSVVFDSKTAVFRSKNSGFRLVKRRFSFQNSVDFARKNGVF